MTTLPRGPRSERPPVAVIGAGMAGLCCALELQRRGFTTRIFEASDRAGGRVRTNAVQGFLLDRGFQVLLTAYPEVQRFLDLDSLELGRFAPGAIVHSCGRARRVADPLRRPTALFDTLRSGVATPADALRIVRLLRRISRGTPEALLTGPSEGFLESLEAQGFSARILRRFFRPFFGGVLLDAGLTGSSRALEFLFRMFATGDAALPARGMGAIPEQLVQRLEPGSLRLCTTVASIEPSAIALTSGQRMEASAIVVATEAEAAGKLLSGLAVAESNAACCLYFDAPSAPPVGDFLVLAADDDGPVNTLCVPSAISPEYAPEGRHLVSVGVLAPHSGDEDDRLECRVRQQLGRWYGGPVAGWRLIRIDRIRHALPSQPPGPFEPAAQETHLGERLFVCGDHRDLASLQGAMASGRRAARAVEESLRG